MNKLFVPWLLVVLLSGGCGGSGSSAPAGAGSPAAGSSASTASSESTASSPSSTQGVGLDDVHYWGPLYQGFDSRYRLMISKEPCPVRNSFYSACIETVTVDGNAGSPADIRDGSIADVEGTILMPEHELPEGTPESTTGVVDVDVQHVVIGPVESIEPSHLQLTILGQRVFLDGSTVVEGTSLQTVSAGDLLAVGGYVVSSGELVATRIEPATPTTPLLLRGLLMESSGGRWFIGATELALASALITGFPGGAPLAGDSVILFADNAPEPGVMTATEMRYTGHSWPMMTNYAQMGGVQGFVTAVRGPGDLDMGGRPLSDVCSVTGSPQLELGSFVGAHYEYCLELDPAPLLNGGTLGVEGSVTTTDPLMREITVLGYRIQVPPTAVINTEWGHPFGPTQRTFDDIGVGAHVIVSGSLVDGVISADQVLLIDRALPGQVETSDFVVDPPLITIAGQSFTLSEENHVSRCYTNTSLDLDALTQDWGVAITLTLSVDPSQSPPLVTAASICSPEWDP